MMYNGRYAYEDRISHPQVSSSFAYDYDDIPYVQFIRPRSAPRRVKSDKLYSSSLNFLTSETKENLNSLRESLVYIDPPRYEQDMKHWHGSLKNQRTNVSTGCRSL